MAISNNLYDIFCTGFSLHNAFINSSVLGQSCARGTAFEHCIEIDRKEDDEYEIYEAPTFCVMNVTNHAKGQQKGYDKYILPLAINQSSAVTACRSNTGEKSILSAMRSLWHYSPSLLLDAACINDPQSSTPFIFYGTRGMICDKNLNPLLLCTVTVKRLKIKMNTPDGEYMMYNSTFTKDGIQCYVDSCIMKYDNILFKGIRSKFIPEFCSHPDVKFIIGNNIPMLRCIKHRSAPSAAPLDVQKDNIYKCLDTYLDEILDQLPAQTSITAMQSEITHEQS